MYGLFLMTYTLFNGYTTYITPQMIGKFETLPQCQQAIKEADFQNVHTANEIRYAFMCVSTGKAGTTAQP